MSVFLHIDEGLRPDQLHKGKLYSLSYVSAGVHLDPTDIRNDHRYGTSLKAIEHLENCYERHTAVKVSRKDVLLCLGMLRLCSYVTDKFADKFITTRVLDSYHITSFLFNEKLVCFAGATFRIAGSPL